MLREKIGVNVVRNVTVNFLKWREIIRRKEMLKCIETRTTALKRFPLYARKLYEPFSSRFLALSSSLSLFPRSFCSCQDRLAWTTRLLSCLGRIWSHFSVMYEKGKQDARWMQKLNTESGYLLLSKADYSTRNRRRGEHGRKALMHVQIEEPF